MNDAFLTTTDCERLFDNPYTGVVKNPRCRILLRPVQMGKTPIDAARSLDLPMIWQGPMSRQRPAGRRSSRPRNVLVFLEPGRHPIPGVGVNLHRRRPVAMSIQM